MAPSRMSVYSGFILPVVLWACSATSDLLRALGSPHLHLHLQFHWCPLRSHGWCWHGVQSDNPKHTIPYDTKLYASIGVSVNQLAQRVTRPGLRSRMYLCRNHPMVATPSD